MAQDTAIVALKMLVALSVVLASFWGVLLLVKKLSNNPRFAKKGTKSKPIEILSYQAMGPSKGLYLIRCCDQKMLIGVTGSNINMISNIEDQESEVFESNLKDKMPNQENENVRQQIASRLGDISRV